MKLDLLTSEVDYLLAVLDGEAGRCGLDQEAGRKACALAGTIRGQKATRGQITCPKCHRLVTLTKTGGICRHKDGDGFICERSASNPQTPAAIRPTQEQIQAPPS